MRLKFTPRRPTHVLNEGGKTLHTGDNFEVTAARGAELLAKLPGEVSPVKDPKPPKDPKPKTASTPRTAQPSVGTASTPTTPAVTH